MDYKLDKKNIEKEEMTNYKNQLISSILEFTDNFKFEELQNKTISTLEKIHDNC